MVLEFIKKVWDETMEVEETVFPSDVNRWENGISDVVEEILRHATSNDHDDVYLPLIEGASNPSNCILKGALDASNNLQFPVADISYKTTEFNSPSMTSNTYQSYIVTQGYYQVFKTGGHLLNGVNSSGTLALVRESYVQKFYITASMTTYYIGGSQTLSFYRKGVKVGTATFNPKSYLNKYYILPTPFLCDTVAVGASSGSAWHGDGGGNASPGYQFYGYQVDSFTQLPNSAIVGKDLFVDFNDATPSDAYGLNAFTLTGSPLFNNGKFVSSGTTGLSYAITNLGTEAWCIQGQFKFNTTNAIYSLFSKMGAASVYALSLVRNGNNRLQMVASSNGTTYDIANVVLGTKTDWDTVTEYIFRLRFTGTEYLVEWSTDGESWTPDITIASTAVVKNYASNTFFAISALTSLYPLAGTMNEIAITVGSSSIIKRNDVSLSAPILGKDLYVGFEDGSPLDSYRLHSLGVVGTPTYENNRYNNVGTSGLYYTLQSMGTSTWCAQGTFKFANTTTDMCLMIKMASATYAAFYLVRTAANRLALYLSTNGTTYLVTALAGAKSDWNTATEYMIRLRFTGLQYLVEWSIDNGETWTADITVNETTPVKDYASNVFFGINGATAPLLGYMKEFGITIGLPKFIKRIPSRTVNFRPEPIYYMDQRRNYGSAEQVAPINLDFCDRSSQVKLFLGSEGQIDKIKVARCCNDLYSTFVNGGADDYNLNQAKYSGSLTLANGKVTGTGCVEYALPTIDPDCWCMQGKFNFASMATSYAFLYSKRNFSFALMHTTANKLQVYLSSNGTSHDIANGVLGTLSNFAANTDYYYRLRFTGAQYLVDWSSDGQVWYNDITINSTAKIYSPEGAMFGGAYNYTALLAGSMTELAYTMGRSTISRRNRYQVGAVPLNPIEGDVWVKCAGIDIEQYKYVSGEWVEYYPVACGDIFTNNFGGIATILQPVWGQNGVNVNRFSKYMNVWESMEYPIVLATPIGITHNLGIEHLGMVIPQLVCKYPIQGYVTGDVLQGPFTLYEGTQPMVAPPVLTKNSIYQPIGDSYSLMIPYKSGATYIAAADVVANFMYKVKLFY